MHETKIIGTKAYEIAQKFKINIDTDSCYDNWENVKHQFWSGNPNRKDKEAAYINWANDMNSLINGKKIQN